MGMLIGLAHITGGGLPGKLTAILPDGLAAELSYGTWEVPPIFRVLQREGALSDLEMFRVFNMGLGMVAVCREAQAAAVQAEVGDAVIVGRVVPQTGDSQVLIDGME